MGVSQCGEEGLSSNELGAGDQGLMFGYACDETPELMPAPIMMAHILTKRLTELRKNGGLPGLRPDGKAQVTMEYQDGHPKRIDSVVVSAQHDEELSIKELRDQVKKLVIRESLPLEWMDQETRVISTHRAVCLGGPVADTGLTSRKIIVDHTGNCPSWQRSFSRKDPTRWTDSYMAVWPRISWLQGLRGNEISLALVVLRIGFRVRTFGTGRW